MITIALHNMAGEEWTAGGVVQEVFLQALRGLPEEKPSLRLTVWKETPERVIAPFRTMVDDVICLPSSGSDARNEVLKQNGVDVFVSLPIESALMVNVPRIVWIYDFQHRHYPENFSLEELERRDRLFKAHADSSSLLLIYSQSVMKDLKEFAARALARARLLRFVPHIPTECYARTAEDTHSRYGLPERFFLMPNHFLPHKNHRVVVEALGQLAARGCRPVVVCTGRRQTPAAERLAERCRYYGVSNQFVCLDVVPREDYFHLLRASLAVINPSRFEGFGLSVAEAKYLGKRAILADIPVMREHEISDAFYAAPDAPDEWANHMKRIWENPAIPLLDFDKLLDVYLCDQRMFGEKLLKLCDDAIEHNFKA